MMPRAGGQYVYLREAWHPVVGFLYGWALLFLIETGAMAAVAITFAQYALRLAGAGGAAPQPIAIGAIVVLSLINYLGVKPGSRVLNVFVVLKVAALAVLILFAWFQPAAPGWFSTVRDRRHAVDRAVVRRSAHSDPVRVRRMAGGQLRR